MYNKFHQRTQDDRYVRIPRKKWMAIVAAARNNRENASTLLKEYEECEKRLWDNETRIVQTGCDYQQRELNERWEAIVSEYVNKKVEQKDQLRDYQELIHKASRAIYNGYETLKNDITVLEKVAQPPALYKERWNSLNTHLQALKTIDEDPFSVKLLPNPQQEQSRENLSLSRYVASKDPAEQRVILSTHLISQLLEEEKIKSKEHTRKKSYLFSSFELEELENSDLVSSNNAYTPAGSNKQFPIDSDFCWQLYSAEEKHMDTHIDNELLDPGYDTDIECEFSLHRNSRTFPAIQETEKQSVEPLVKPDLEIIQENNSERSNSNEGEGKVQSTISDLFTNQTPRVFSNKPLISPLRKRGEHFLYFPCNPLSTHGGTKTTQALSHGCHTINEYSTFEPKKLLEKVGIRYTKQGKPLIVQINKRLNAEYVVSLAEDCKGDDRLVLSKAGITFGAGLINNYLYALNQSSITLVRSRNKPLLRSASSSVVGLSLSRYSFSEQSQKELLKIKRKNIIPIEGVGSHVIIPRKEMLSVHGISKLHGQFIQ
eukprot:TRINITY_DN135873_c0_g1_i1.p1 TRINITY_DN135873_c0_g1~~TRINITY_DN135873_c0_g1_i1.p1  ORF type:complete len:543 (-),score=27.05 TRINITY_DN135873_c0_g1_i1:83-1711(-)